VALARTCRTQFDSDRPSRAAASFAASTSASVIRMIILLVLVISPFRVTEAAGHQSVGHFVWTGLFAGFEREVFGKHAGFEYRHHAVKLWHELVERRAVAGLVCGLHHHSELCCSTRGTLAWWQSARVVSRFQRPRSPAGHAGVVRASTACATLVNGQEFAEASHTGIVRQLYAQGKHKISISASVR